MPDANDPARSLSEEINAALAREAAGGQAQPNLRQQLLSRVQQITFAALLVALVVALASPALARRKPAPVPAGPIVTAPPSAEALAILDQAIAGGRLDDARQLIGSMWASGVPEVALRGAELALASGSLPEAADGFAMLVDGPLTAAARQGLGITRLKQGRGAEAKTELEAAVALNPALARAWNALAVLADRTRDWPAADAAYGKAIAAAPGDASLFANRGWSMLMRGHHVAAEQDLARAHAMAPDMPQVRTNLALARAMQGRYQDAFLLSNKKTLAVDLNTVGYAAMARGDLAVAEGYFNRALTINPQFDRAAWENLQYVTALKGEARQPQ